MCLTAAQYAAVRNSAASAVGNACARTAVWTAMRTAAIFNRAIGGLCGEILTGQFAFQQRRF